MFIAKLSEERKIFIVHHTFNLNKNTYPCIFFKKGYSYPYIELGVQE